MSKAKWCGSEDEFSAIYYGDSIYYCARKRTQVLGVIEDAQGNYQTNLFAIKKDASSSKEGNLVFREIDHSVNFGPVTPAGSMESSWITLSKDQGRRRCSTTGIYECCIEKGDFRDLVPFPYNDTTGAYEVGHPFVTFDGLHLYFSSDMPGGFGAKDIYVCHRGSNKLWSKPENLGPTVNSNSDEISPFLATSGYFYFSSNRADNNFDLYESVFLNDIYGEVTKLPEPINSPLNDFGLTFDNSGKVGLFSSDRTGDLDVYELFYDFPRFENCLPAHETNYCYLFEDLSIQRIDTIPMRFEWDFGDGHRAPGLVTEHCYEKPGRYLASLSIIDTITNLLYAKVSEVEVLIEKFRRPFIESLDVVEVGRVIDLKSDMDCVTDFIPSKYYWFFGDGSKACEEMTQHTYNSPGLYTITLGVVADENNGIIEKVCATKQLYIVSEVDSTSGNYLPEDSTVVQEPVGNQEYYVELLNSKISVSLSDSVFSTVNHEITERYHTSSDRYIYSVGKGTSYADLTSLFYEMRKCGFESALVKEEKLDNPQTLFVKQGWYISESRRREIHSEVYKFRNILFENNSADLKEESKALLDEISEVMNNEEHFRMHIVAHTDDIGNDDYNYELSKNRAETVMNYLIGKGIESRRLSCEGMGENSPIASNETEEGKARNRRVEFQLLFESIYGEYGSQTEK